MQGKSALKPHDASLNPHRPTSQLKCPLFNERDGPMSQPSALLYQRALVRILTV